MKARLRHILGYENVRRLALLKKSVQVHLNRAKRRGSKGARILSNISVAVFSLPGAHLFFGYYDVSQFSRDENLLLATAAPLINRTPAAGECLRLGFYDLDEKNPGFREFASTSMWCWQQGCRLQWYPFDVGSATVLYNDIVAGSYGCVIQDVCSGNIIRSFQRPIYMVSRDGRWGLSLNFSRLQRLRPGYGYNVLSDISQNNPKPTDDGIWRIDMVTGDEKLLLSIHDIAELKPNPAVNRGEHYFNHLLFNVEGDRFMFFHICQLVDGSRHIRMLTSNINGDEVRVLNDSGHSSHYCWKDNDHLLCYSTVQNKGEGYYLYDTRTGLNQIVGSDCLLEDGHPSYLPGGVRLITDTYPDQYGESFLLVYDCEKEKLTMLDKEYLPVWFYGETRCDLHPRVSPSGKFVCIDTVAQGKRVMKLLEISNV